jgi:hypothetical protein
MEFSKILLEDIYNKVKVDGWNAMDAVSTFGEAWGFKRNQRFELFEAFAQYCDEKKLS